METEILNKLFEKKLITELEFKKIHQQQKAATSVHWELRTLLYPGILLLSTSLGILVYKNIDTLGHDVIVTSIGLVCIACFWYCFKNAKGYSSKKVPSPHPLCDYLLLLGCILLLTLVAYVQFEYSFFGNRWGLATFIPTVLLFLAAYYFDHLGVLSLAVVSLAAWVGISVTPMRVIKDNDFTSRALIYSAIIFGAFFIAISYASVRKDIKEHFNFTYKNFGVNILLISLLAAMFNFTNIYFLWFLLLLLTFFLFSKKP